MDNEGKGIVMKLTVSVMKADIGSIGGHICPSERLFETVRSFVEIQGRQSLLDHYVSFTGDDIAIVMTHTKGEGHKDIHQLAGEAFLAGM